MFTILISFPMPSGTSSLGSVRGTLPVATHDVSITRYGLNDDLDRRSVTTGMYQGAELIVLSP